MPPKLTREQEKKIDEKGQIELWIPLRFWQEEKIILTRQDGGEIEVEVMEVQNLGKGFRYLHVLKTLRHSALEAHMDKQANENGTGPRTSSLPTTIEELMDSDYLVLAEKAGVKAVLSKGKHGHVILIGGEFRYEPAAGALNGGPAFYTLRTAGAVVECIRDWDPRVSEMRLVDVVLNDLAKLILPT